MERTVKDITIAHGNSLDEKPTTWLVGSKYKEEDTGIWFIWSGSEWVNKGIGGEDDTFDIDFTGNVSVDGEVGLDRTISVQGPGGSGTVQLHFKKGILWKVT